MRMSVYSLRTHRITHRRPCRVSIDVPRCNGRAVSTKRGQDANRGNQPAANKLRFRERRDRRFRFTALHWNPCYQAHDLVDVKQDNILFVQRFELKAIRKRFEILEDRFGIHKMSKIGGFSLFLRDQRGVFAIIDRHEDHQLEFVVVVSVVGIHEARVIEIF